MSQASFQKQQQEKARRERAAAKWAKRIERGSTAAAEPAEAVREQAEVLAELTELHEHFEVGRVAFGDLRP